MGCYLHSSQKWTRPLVIGVFSPFASHSMLFFSDATLLTQSKTGHKGYFAVFHVKKKSATHAVLHAGTPVSLVT